MARPVHSRLKISGKLEAETPLHVGGLGGNTDSDMALAINGKGEFYVPGTSLAGVLRAWCEKNFGERLTNETWGFQEKDSQIAGTDKDKSHASFVLIEDATIENAADILTEVRDGVGIDRYYSVAAEGAKYDREILPKDTKLNFAMTVEIENPEDADKTKEIFGHLLEALENAELRFGGSRTRGLGKLKLELAEIKEQKLKGKDEKGLLEILKLLSNGGNSLTISELKGNSALEGKTRLEIIIDWSPVQPLMVKAGFEGIGVDMLPLTSQTRNGNISLVLPGSSIKGSLRSHAERIMRTLLDLPIVKVSDNPKITFHDQINKIPLVEEIFGAKADREKNKEGRSGALAIDDCYAEKTFDAKDWNAVTTGRTKVGNDEVSYENQELWKALRKIDGADLSITEQVKKDTETFKIHHHNAIDRFTGGAADSALYSVLAPAKIGWREMRFSLDFSRTENPRQCLMLLLLVLRDLTENRLPLGFATNRGMGEIKVKSIKLKGKNLEGFENEIVLSDGKMSELDKTFRGNLAKEWTAWLTNQTR